MYVCNYTRIKICMMCVCNYIDFQVKSRQFKQKDFSDSTFFGLKIFLGKKCLQTKHFLEPKDFLDPHFLEPKFFCDPIFLTYDIIIIFVTNNSDRKFSLTKYFFGL